jgi:outer membrane lipoprotein carrier protein
MARSWVRVFTLLGAAWGLLGGGAAWGWTSDEIAEGIQRHYSQVRDLQADFRQETTLPMMSRVNEARGRISLKIPGRLRWDYLEGQKKTVVINGDTMWFYEPQDRQVTVTDLARVPNSQDLLTFLTGVGDLRKEFIMDPARPLEETRDGHVTVHLLPRNRNAQWTQLRLVVDPKTFHVMQTAFEGVQGDKTVIEYRNIRTDVGLADELFKFEVPAGTDVLHYPPKDKP